MKRLLLIFVIVLILIGGGYFFRNELKTMVAPVANEYSGWVTYTNVDHTFAFTYPKDFGANVWKVTKRPPMITLVAKDKDPIALGCPNLNNLGIPLTPSHGKITNGLTYSLYQGGDAGAGSLYSLYCYVIQGTKNDYVLYFEVRSHTGCQQGGCGAYCETKFEQECRDFDLARDVATPIDKVVHSFQEIK